MEPRLRNRPTWTPATAGRSILAALVILAGFLFLVQGVASANGRAELVHSQNAGPYQVDVSILPGQAVVGRTHISVLLRSLATGEVLTAASVAVSATGPPGSTNMEPVAALNEFPPSFFETDLAFDLVGRWEVLVTVSSELGEARVLVPLQVREGGGGINLILMAAVAVIILAAGVFIWGRVPGRRRSRGGAE